MTVPLRPVFAVDGAPPGVDVRFVSFWQDRPILAKVRSIFVHTMAAPVPTSVQQAWNYAHARPGSNTCPTYAVGLDGDAAKFLPSNRRSIATATVTRSTVVNGVLLWPTLTNEQRAEIDRYGQVRDHSLSIETADTGSNIDPQIAALTAPQIETTARIIAYEHFVTGYPVEFLVRWFAAGIGSHTDPDGFPYTTIHRGKFCPGSKKKAQMRTVVMGRVREIVAAWTSPPDPLPIPPPPPPLIEEDAMSPWLIVKTTDGPHLAARTIRAGALHVSDDVPLAYVFAAGGGRAFDLGSGRVVTVGEWPATKAVITKAQALQYLGAEI